MTDERDSAANDPDAAASDEMAQYLQVYIEESDEELESLVEAILRLEVDPRDSEALHKAFRMLHSLKGSSGMLGFETIGGFAHELEDRFERYRSGQATLDRDTATLVLKCVDFLKSFLDRLRAGDLTEGDPKPLLQQLRELEQKSSSHTAEPTTLPAASKPSSLHLPALTMSGGLRIVVRFRQGLQLADLKARLIVSRLSSLGEIIGCEPPIDDVSSVEELKLFSLVLVTDRTIDEVRKVANVDGVESIAVEGGNGPDSIAAVRESMPSTLKADIATPAATAPLVPAENRTAASSTEAAVAAVATAVDESGENKAQVSESLRVDIGRLDELLNLTGELVVAQARFAQITDEMSPMFRRSGVASRSRDIFDRLRQRVHEMRQATDNTTNGANWSDDLQSLEDDLKLLEEQSSLWEESRQYFSGIAEATDQLLRVSKNLQRGVLNTRMVPVGPLFNRFKRVVRDLSVSRKKQVNLTIAGEKTELDKRMIDALGDPLLHLVRNSIDHGLESTNARRAAGKPEVGTVSLEAVHRGNNVLITVCDDGGGINVSKIRTRIVERRFVSASQVEELSDQQVIDYIWHPGFSTAESVTEISGRGVGMDIVQSAIAALSGTIDVSSTPGEGTTFTIRLPLTLAIIHSLLVRFRDGCFSIPIDDVREIVSVAREHVHSAHRYRTIDVRGELIPLMDMSGIFAWHQPADKKTNAAANGQSSLNVVILQSRGKALGLSVDSLVGRADIVVKSLSENFTPVRGLSGASILGDGSVSLMLDPAALIELASERASVRTAI